MCSPRELGSTEVARHPGNAETVAPFSSQFSALCYCVPEFTDTRSLRNR